MLNMRLILIQSTLREGIHLKLDHGNDWSQEGPWNVALVTDRNTYPYWIQFHGQTPDDALFKLQQYLGGTRPDHARDQRPPSAFLMDVPETTAQLTKEG
jgi:hypothetical protein